MLHGSDRLTSEHDTLAAQASLPWHRRRFGGVPLMVLAGVCAVIALLWFGTLGIRHLIGPDEGRYAEIAREMFVSGDWVTIRYNALKYFEKPPFHMWVTALSYVLFGIGDWQARLCVALAGAIGLLASMLAAHRWFGARAALLTGLVMVAAPMWSVAAHFNTLDMTLSGAMACVLAFMLLAQHPDATPAARRNWMLACWLAMGVAILTKGLVGMALPGLVLVIYTLVTRDLGLWRRLHLASGIALMLLVAVPWFWLVSERNPEFLRFFFIHEHWERYTSNVHSRKGPLLYFVPLVLGGFLPWLGLVPRMWRAVRERAGVTSGMAASAPRPFQPALLAAIWAVAIFVFFSLSHSKLPGYILPVFPALGILGGVALDAITERSWRRQLVAGLAIGVIGLLASPIVATLNSNNTPNALYRAYAVWAAVAFALMIASTLVARWLLPRRGLMASITVYAVGMCTAFTAALLGHEVIGRSASGIDMIAPVARVLRPDMKLYSVRVLDHTLPFYLRHTLVMVDRPDELEFGVTQEPQKWQPTTAAFLAAWQDGQPAMAIMSPHTFAELSQRAPMHVVARDWRRVAVANFAVSAPAQQR
ncbi:Undecaprenyl phosphate-alpha-4-amino-4-deoxy-L-arabinose arabinosyl transferase [Cupriavidus yeoncheonensis]|uniref:Undecaprenyl phosphate-alpha-4-amino-4-deoxy-L-arabinose arabinosyl transferase n=1 Tax=Cupriavidus yeoncheonensis TaxID=1462994 RepID=A0A916IUU4_9BURK|nr:glycosyltransferase family 39 protein [Cupriavidus yeoncheonensis]CAG2144897.1 Undecaprenyl phosphate-alpha-4-amino-4-deoxy-L-arabinose arabinosyl transferase [Cupriavidus yeoncheonensis]